MQVDIGSFIGYLIGLAGVILAGVGALRNHAADKRQAETESRQEGKEGGGIRTDIDYLKRRADETLLEQKETNRSLGVLGERVAKVEALTADAPDIRQRVAKVEESTKSAHHRIDGLERRMDGAKEGE